MNKKFFLLSFSLLSAFSFAQVGIKTTSPAATLDVVATNPTGISNSVDGFIPPRVNLERMQSMLSIPNGTMVYCNDVTVGAAAGITADVTSVGYYFFNGTKWVKMVNEIIQSSVITASNGLSSSSGDVQLGGPLTRATNVSGLSGTNVIAFTGNAVNAFRVGPVLSVDLANNSLGIRTTSPEQPFHIGTTSPVVVDAHGNMALGKTTAIEQSAILDLSDVTNKGVALPRVSLSSNTDQAAVGGNVINGLIIFNNNGNATRLKRGVVYWDDGEWRQLTIEQVGTTIAGNATSMSELVDSTSNAVVTSPDGNLSVRLFDCNNGGCIPQFRSAGNGDIITINERQAGSGFSGSIGVNSTGFQILTADGQFKSVLNSGTGVGAEIRMLTLNNAEIWRSEVTLLGLPKKHYRVTFLTTPDTNLGNSNKKKMIIEQMELP